MQFVELRLGYQYSCTSTFNFNGCLSVEFYRLVQFTSAATWKRFAMVVCYFHYVFFFSESCLGGVAAARPYNIPRHRGACRLWPFDHFITLATLLQVPDVLIRDQVTQILYGHVRFTLYVIHLAMVLILITVLTTWTAATDIVRVQRRHLYDFRHLIGAYSAS